MNRENKLIRNLGLQLATAGVSALLLVSPVSAQSDSANQADSEQVPQAVQMEVRELDQNDDQKLQWDEVQPRIEEAGLEDEWDEDRLMSEFDEDDDDALDAQEYNQFLTEAGQDSQSGQTAQRDQQEQREIEVESADVTVDPAEPQVSVEQQSPDVTVEQADSDVSVERQPPEVTVRQPSPEVTVTQPKPDVQVKMPEPEVEVTQADPNVDVEQGQPDVQVEQQEPQVSVQQGEPDVSVERPEQEVVVQPERPDVTLEDDQQQASVDVQSEDEQSQVQVEQSEPDVQVSEAEPEVTVETGDTADVEIQRPEGEQEQQQAQQQQEQDETAMEDIEEMESPAAGVTSEEQQQAQGLDSMQIGELEGQTLYNADGNELGEIEHVAISPDGNQAGVVLSVGGVLGIGSEQVAAPLDELSMENDQLVWETSMIDDELKQQEEYTAEGYTEVSPDQYQTLGELRQSVGQ